MSTQYEEYYKDYLGIESKAGSGQINICSSIYRTMPINKRFLYCAIITGYNNKVVISCAKEYQEVMIENCSGLRVTSDLDYYKENIHIPDLKVRKFYRMILDGENESNPSLNKNYDYEYREEYRKYMAKYQGEIIAYCKISDIHCGFGNIVVYTDEKFRRTGLATSLLKLLLDKCKEDGILPLYMVDSTNIASINLAKKVGFIVKNEEIVFSKEKAIGIPVSGEYIMKM